MASANTLTNPLNKPLTEIVRHPLQTQFLKRQEARRVRHSMLADLRATIWKSRRYIEGQDTTEASVFVPILENMIEQLSLIDRLEKSI